MEKIWICRHCGNSFVDLNSANKQNHSRWCPSNPKHQAYLQGASERIAQRNKVVDHGNQFIKAKKQGRHINVSLETRNKISQSCLGRQYSEETLARMSAGCLASPHRRFKRRVIKYTTKSGKCVLMDSGWEVLLANLLDEKDVEWVRPEPIIYEKNGKKHHYFPDFFLPVQNLFLDPKSPYMFVVQAEKIAILEKQLPNLLFLRSVEEIKQFVHSLS
jgi:hypothetical protein